MVCHTPESAIIWIDLLKSLRSFLDWFFASQKFFSKSRKELICVWMILIKLLLTLGV